MAAALPITAVLADRFLLGAGLGKLGTWRAWTAFLKCLFGLPLTGWDRVLYRQCTGRTVPRRGLSREAYVIVGRRAGKSRMLAAIAVYLACFFDWRPFLAPGEIGTIMVIAADRRQARTIFGYMRGFLRGSRYLSGLLARETMSEIELSTGIRIEMHTASYRAVRSYTVVAALLDEAAFWRAENSANPDREILNAIRPTLTTMPNSMLLVASSPFARRGIVYHAFRRWFGVNKARVLVWKAPTETMNPTFNRDVLEDAYEEDAASAATEYGAEFRSDSEMPFPAEMVDACTDHGVRMRAPELGVQYVGFVDPSGGSQDEMALAIAHLDHKTRVSVLDLLESYKPPFSPEAVTEMLAITCKRYGLSWVYGDAYGGEWPKERFGRNGVTYQLCEFTKSQLYHHAVPLITGRRAALLDDPKLEAQLTSIERRPSRVGKMAYDHPVHAHDDVANCAVGALVMAQRGALYLPDMEDHVGQPLAAAVADFTSPAVLSGDLGHGPSY